MVCVGKDRERFVLEGVEKYRRLLDPFFRLEQHIIPPSPASVPIPVQIRRETEAIRRYLEHRKQGDFFILDRQGRTVDSAGFAGMLKSSMECRENIIFVLGGPYGLDIDFVRGCKTAISLSPLTFSHQMVRLILLEQIYRAISIIRGTPYHHA